MPDPAPPPVPRASRARRRALLLLTLPAVALAGCIAPEPAPPGEPCGPEGLTANALIAALVELGWLPKAGATDYGIYRGENGGALTLLAAVPGTETSYQDGAVSAGTTYAYRVTALVGGEETAPCGTAEVTAVPFLPGPLAALALAGAVAAGYALLRRRA